MLSMLLPTPGGVVGRWRVFCIKMDLEQSPTISPPTSKGQLERAPTIPAAINDLAVRLLQLMAQSEHQVQHGAAPNLHVTA